MGRSNLSLCRCPSVSCWLTSQQLLRPALARVEHYGRTWLDECGKRYLYNVNIPENSDDVGANGASRVFNAVNSHMGGSIGGDVVGM